MSAIPTAALFHGRSDRGAGRRPARRSPSTQSAAASSPASSSRRWKSPRTKPRKTYSRYGSSVHKQVYIYGGLDTGPTELNRSFGMAWGVGGWLLTPFPAEDRAGRRRKAAPARGARDQDDLCKPLHPRRFARRKRCSSRTSPPTTSAPPGRNFSSIRIRRAATGRHDLLRPPRPAASRARPACTTRTTTSRARKTIPPRADFRRDAIEAHRRRHSRDTDSRHTRLGVLKTPYPASPARAFAGGGLPVTFQRMRSNTNARNFGLSADDEAGRERREDRRARIGGRPDSETCCPELFA
jgi:hypothetical protein